MSDIGLECWRRANCNQQSETSDRKLVNKDPAYNTCALSGALVMCRLLQIEPIASSFSKRANQSKGWDAKSRVASGNRGGSLAAERKDVARRKASAMQEVPS